MEKMPTAEEFFIDKYFGEHIPESEKKMCMQDDMRVEEALAMMIEFAKLHVEAALKAADVRTENEVPEGFWDYVDDKNFIINSYSLENIK